MLGTSTLCATGGTERIEDLLKAAVVTEVIEELVQTALDAGATGGVDDPNLDGIDIDESDDVDETGEGIAVALVETPLFITVFVLVVGASKFVIVGECFLLFVANVPLVD